MLFLHLSVLYQSGVHSLRSLSHAKKATFSMILLKVVIGLAFSLLSTNIWPTLTFIALEMGLIYTFE